MNLVKQIVKDELTAIRDKYGDGRLTEIQEVEDEIDDEDLIEEETCCFTLSNAGYIKRLPVDTYRAQRRGGRGVNGQNLKDEDYVKNLYIASTHDYLLFFTNLGRVHRRKGYLIPEAGRAARHEHRQRPAARAGRDGHGDAADARILQDGVSDDGHARRHGKADAAF